jgi:hypothetical protein
MRPIATLPRLTSEHGMSLKRWWAFSTEEDAHLHFKM